MFPQGGTNESDYFHDVASVGNGSVVLGGFTDGSWNSDNQGGSDFAALKLDSNGSVVWAWQVVPCPSRDVQCDGASVRQNADEVSSSKGISRWRSFMNRIYCNGPTRNVSKGSDMFALNSSIIDAATG